MKPLTSHSYFEAVALCCVPVMCVFLTWALWPVHHAIQSNSQGSAAVLAKVGTNLDKIGIALDTVNAPPRDDGHQIVYGTLSGVAQTTKNIGLMAAQGAEQVKQSGKLITSAAVTITTVGKHLSKTADAATGTLNSASGAFDTLSKHGDKTLGAADVQIAAVGAQLAGTPGGDGGLIGRVSLFVTHADTLATNSDIPLIMGNVQGFTKLFVTTTGTFNHMLLTGDQIETKVSECTLHPHLSCQLKAYTMFGAQAGGYLLH
jgi:hypothetical protein